MIRKAEVDINIIQGNGIEKQKVDNLKNFTKEESSFKKILDSQKDSIPNTISNEVSTEEGFNKIYNLDVESLDELTVDEIMNALENIINILNASKNTKDNTLHNNVNEINFEAVEVTENLISENNYIIESKAELFNERQNEISQVSLLLNKLVELMEDKNVEEVLSTDTVTDMKDILRQLQINVEDNVNTELDKVELNSILERFDKQISKLQVNKQKYENAKELPVSTILGEKVNDEIINDKTMSNESFDFKESEQFSDNLEKEEKILKSILGEENDVKVSKFSLFTEKTISKDIGIKNETAHISKTTMPQDVVKNIKYMDVNGLKELVVKIKPKELGEIAIKLIQDDGSMKANIKASSKETYNLLSQNLSDIKKCLGEQNIKIQEINLSIYNEDTTFFKDGEFSSNFFQGNQQDSKDEKRDNENKIIDTENIEYEEEIEEVRNINMLA